MKCKRVHHRKEDYDILICRPSKWGNPFSSKQNSTAEYKVSTRGESIERYREWILRGEGKYLLEDLHELEGKILGCWCEIQLGSGIEFGTLISRYHIDRSNQNLVIQSRFKILN